MQKMKKRREGYIAIETICMQICNYYNIYIIIYIVCNIHNVNNTTCRPCCIGHGWSWFIRSRVGRIMPLDIVFLSVSVNLSALPATSGVVIVMRLRRLVGRVSSSNAVLFHTVSATSSAVFTLVVVYLSVCANLSAVFTSSDRILLLVRLRKLRRPCSIGHGF